MPVSDGDDDGEKWDEDEEEEEVEEDEEGRGGSSRKKAKQHVEQLKRLQEKVRVRSLRFLLRAS